MERVQLESFLDLDGLMIKPSIKDKLANAMYKSHALTYGDFCKHSEAELLDIDFLTHDLYVILREQVISVGLHINMTDKELDDYKDAEFVKNNPEVIQPTNEAKQEESSKDKSAEQLSNELKEKHNAILKKMQTLPYERLYLNDLEWMLHQIRLQLLTHQPWYIKIFCPFSWRLQIAIGQAQEMFDEISEDIIKRAMNYQSVDDSKELK